MTVPPFDSPRGRIVHRCAALLVLAAVAGLFFGLGTLGREAPWPFEVRDRRLLTDEVTPGGHLLVRRLIDYHDDCEIRIDRRVQSSLPGGRRFVPDPTEMAHPPWDRSGKPQQSSILLPANFPCGPAYLVESVSVGCSWYERLIRKRAKPDVIFPFFAVGCG